MAGYFYIFSFDEKPILLIILFDRVSITIILYHSLIKFVTKNFLKQFWMKLVGLLQYSV